MYVWGGGVFLYITVLMEDGQAWVIFRASGGCAYTSSVGLRSCRRYSSSPDQLPFPPFICLLTGLCSSSSAHAALKKAHRRHRRHHQPYLTTCSRLLRHRLHRRPRHRYRCQRRLPPRWLHERQRPRLDLTHRRGQQQRHSRPPPQTRSGRRRRGDTRGKKRTTKTKTQTPRNGVGSNVRRRQRRRPRSSIHPARPSSSIPQNHLNHQR